MTVHADHEAITAPGRPAFADAPSVEERLWRGDVTVIASAAAEAHMAHEKRMAVLRLWLWSVLGLLGLGVTYLWGHFGPITDTGATLARFELVSWVLLGLGSVATFLGGMIYAVSTRTFWEPVALHAGDEEYLAKCAQDIPAKVWATLGHHGTRLVWWRLRQHRYLDPLLCLEFGGKMYWLKCWGEDGIEIALPTLAPPDFTA